MEWMGMRQVDALRGRHFFVLFDLLYFGGQWQGDVPCRQRYGNMRTLVALHKARLKVTTPNVIVVDSADSGLMELFDAQKKNPLTEGVVIKHGISPLIGNLRRPQDNPLWKKIEYRD
jgi:ATP-dependent DNA ligase